MDLSSSTTVTQQQQQPPRDSGIRTRSSTPFDDDGHYTDIHTNDIPKIPTRLRPPAVDNLDHSGLASDQPMIDEGLTEQRQTSLNAYLLPREYVNISDASQTTGSGVHDYLELIYSRDGNETAEQRQASPHDYHGLDPSVLATPRQPPAPRAYTSPRHKTPGVGQDVHDTVSVGRNPAYYVGLDSAGRNEYLLPYEYVNSGTTQTARSNVHRESIADWPDGSEISTFV